MREVWKLFWEMISMFLNSGKDIASNIGTGTVGLSAGYRELGLWTEDMAKELRVREEV